MVGRRDVRVRRDVGAIGVGHDRRGQVRIAHAAPTTRSASDRTTQCRKVCCASPSSTSGRCSSRAGTSAATRSSPGCTGCSPTSSAWRRSGEDDGSAETRRGWIVDARRRARLPLARSAARRSASDLWPDRSMRFGSAVLSRWPIDEATLPPPADRDPDGNPVVDERAVGAAPRAHRRPRRVRLPPGRRAPTHGLHRQLQVVAIDDDRPRGPRRPRRQPARIGAQAEMPCRAILVRRLQRRAGERRDPLPVRRSAAARRADRPTTRTRGGSPATGRAHTQDWRDQPDRRRR